MEKTKKGDLMKASFIIIRKKPEIITILVREDKKVLFNFGSEIWVDFFDICDSEKLTSDKGKNKKFRDWVGSKKFQEDYNKTITIIKNNSYEEIVKKFIRDFKKDRAPIFRKDVEINPNVSMEDM